MPQSRSRSLAILVLQTVLLTGIIVSLASCHKNTETNNQSSNNQSSQSSNFESATKSANLLAYYRLESTSGRDETGGSTYTSMGGVSSDQGAPIGIDGNKSVLLNGKDGWVSTTQNGGITKAASMMAWVKLAALPSDAGHFFYVAGESQVANDLDLQFETDNSLRFYTAAGSHLQYLPDPKPLVNQWHMIVATMDIASRTRALYWDGQLVASDQDAGYPNKTAPFSMGASTKFAGRFLNGNIDEVALWGRSLSADEVAAIYKFMK